MVAVRVGILGLEHMHAASYVDQVLRLGDLALLAGVFDVDTRRATALARRLPVTVAPDPDGLIAASDAVIVTSANASHRYWAEQVLSKGKPVLCEKPLAVTSPDARFLLNLSRRQRVPIYTAFPVRFSPAAQRLRDIVTTGELGRILGVSATNHGSNPGGWFTDPMQSGGGAVTDHSPHVVDLLRWMFGSDVTQVFAEVIQGPVAEAVEEYALLTLRFDNGLMATLDPSWSRPAGHPSPVDVTMEVVGSLGVGRLDVFSDHLSVYKSDGDGGLKQELVRLGDNLDGAMIREFVSSVQRGVSGPTIASGLDGLRAVEVTEAAYQSAGQHRLVDIAPRERQ